MTTKRERMTDAELAHIGSCLAMGMSLPKDMQLPLVHEVLALRAALLAMRQEWTDAVSFRTYDSSDAFDVLAQVDALMPKEKP